MSSLYIIGMIFTSVTLLFQIKAAYGVKQCSSTLPNIWVSFAIGCLFFMFDTILAGNIIYSLYFALNAFIMGIAAAIVWNKTW